MPARSTAQKHLMSMALGVRMGKLKAEDVPPNVRRQVLRLARDKSIDLEAYARTPAKGLPKHVGSSRGPGRGRARYA